MADQDNVIIGALGECTSRESIENVFSRFQIEETSIKTERLNETMGNPQTFFSSDDISVDEKYEITVAMFLTMAWKLSKLYDRLGVGV